LVKCKGKTIFERNREGAMRKLLLGILLLFGMLTGCSNQSDTTPGKEPQMVDVAIKFVPEKINPNEEAKIEAVVTQGKDKVSDANEVKFEIWKTGQDQHEMIEGKNEGKGVYSVKKTFSESGNYFVTAHVTARNLHTMPNKEFTVGK
jgi:hypothetical protein